MKFTVERSVLTKAMTLADSVIEARNTVPILSNVMLKAHGDRLRLTSTDLDITIEQAVPASVEAGGGVTVHSRTLADIVKKLPDGAEIGCELGDHRLTVKSGRSRFQLQTLPVEDFPDISSSKEGVRFAMEAAAFRRLIAGPLYAASTDETRYYLNGVYLHCREAHGDLAACATDGHQLALYWDGRPEDAAGMPGVIVPRKTCGLFAKYLDGVKGEVEVKVSNSRMSVAWGEASITTKLIDGTFPDYERVIPRGNQLVTDISGEAMKASVARVITVTEEKSSAVRIELKPNVIELHVNNYNGGAATDVVDVFYDGPETFVGFNARYLTAAIDAMGGGIVRMAVADAQSPAVFTPANGGNCMAVVMPMRA